MKKSQKILIAFSGTILVLSVALGIVGFILGLQESRDREDTNVIPAEIVDAFQNKLVSRGVEKQGQPIEGFDAFLLMQAFPGLQEEDFDGVLAFEGVYRYEGGQLVYERIATQPITSAERTISNKGYGILLENLSKRLGISVQDEQAAEALIEVLENPTSTPSPVPVGKPVTILGEITCLPKKGSGPQTLECAIGLKGEDGKHYALTNLFKYDPDYRFSTTGLQVEVVGVLSTEGVFGPDGNAYDIVGTIDIASIKENLKGQEIILREGQRESSFLLQNIYSDYVEGLNFWEYPVATDRGYPVTLRVGEIVSNGCTVQLTLIRIEGDTAVFVKKTDFNRPCPICLAENTLIDTPSGEVAVQKLHTGDLVWTANAEGKRVAGVVLETAKTSVSATHQVVHIALEDGREVFASPKHPTADGRSVGELSPGDVLDGSNVASATLVSYAKGYTYDILPSGETGFYWADGVLLGSTLR
ncbi:MAG: Hint domain-containing protein [Candidatus Wildermuthbacteria bacterium]|nr:Hint domain-containing protein [Candidatus Wildermuthbacteria bacterium]